MASWDVTQPSITIFVSDDSGICVGTNGMEDLATLQVVAKDETGSTIAVSSKPYTSIWEPDGEWQGSLVAGSCTFLWPLFDVPSGKAFYTFDFGLRGDLTYSEADLVNAGGVISLYLSGY